MLNTLQACTQAAGPASHVSRQGCFFRGVQSKAYVASLVTSPRSPASSCRASATTFSRSYEGCAGGAMGACSGCPEDLKRYRYHSAAHKPEWTWNGLRYVPQISPGKIRHCYRSSGAPQNPEFGSTQGPGRLRSLEHCLLEEATCQSHSPSDVYINDDIGADPAAGMLQQSCGQRGNASAC